ncbi:hypothetical protein C8Q76DRAFT_466561 [Earliella scabrosa]|nr:hypothetical protein C8Q76DRAFT_466561 [Earliella scabrosa]
MSSGVTSVPLNDRLPPDVLSDIFVSYAEECFDAQQIGSQHWILLSHVCHQWRAVALSSPRFWSHLHLLRPTAFAALLERSKSVPLHISIAVDKNAFEYVGDIFDLVRNEWHRVQEFRLAAPARDVQDFCRRLPMPGARLESLVLRENRSIADDRFGSEPPLPLANDASLFPHLRHLALRLMPFKWTDPIFRSPITTLRVRGRFSRKLAAGGHPDMGTFEQLLSVLKHLAPTLMELDLQESIPRALPLVRSNLGANVRPVAFPALRLLRLVGYRRDSVRLLNYLTLPASTRIRLVCYDANERERDPEDILHTLSRHRFDTLQSLHIKQPSRRGSTRPRARVLLRGWTTREPGSKADAALEVLSHEAGVTPDTVLTDSGALFASVQTMVFDRFDIDSLVGLIPWRTAAESAAVAASSAGAPGDWSGRVVVVPNLKTLELRSLALRTPPNPVQTRGVVYVGAMLAWLRVRREHGAALDALRLVQCVNVSEEIVAGLKEGVADVWWDGALLESRVEDESGSERESEDNVEPESWYERRRRLLRR